MNLFFFKEVICAVMNQVLINSISSTLISWRNPNPQSGCFVVSQANVCILCFA